MDTLFVKTTTRFELLDITDEITAKLSAKGLNDGLCFLFNPHTTAGLTINEGADPDVRADIIAGLQEMVPMDHSFSHVEGNSPAHIMTSLIGSSVTFAVTENRPLLGTWQKIFFCEFDGPRNRKIQLHYLKN